MKRHKKRGRRIGSRRSRDVRLCAVDAAQTRRARRCVGRSALEDDEGLKERPRWRACTTTRMMGNGVGAFRGGCWRCGMTCESDLRGSKSNYELTWGFRTEGDDGRLPRPALRGSTAVLSKRRREQDVVRPQACSSRQRASRRRGAATGGVFSVSRPGDPARCLFQRRLCARVAAPEPCECFDSLLWMRMPLILATQAAHDAFIARRRGRDVWTSRERRRGAQSTLIVGRPSVEVRDCPCVEDSACGIVECLVKICLAPVGSEATYRRPASEDSGRTRDWANRCPCGLISSPASLFWAQRGCLGCCELLRLSLAPVDSEATYRRPASWGADLSPRVGFGAHGRQSGRIASARLANFSAPATYRRPASEVSCRAVPISVFCK